MKCPLDHFMCLKALVDRDPTVPFPSGPEGPVKMFLIFSSGAISSALHSLLSSATAGDDTGRRKEKKEWHLC
eukprot:s2914_g3.t1